MRSRLLVLAALGGDRYPDWGQGADDHGTAWLVSRHQARWTVAVNDAG